VKYVDEMTLNPTRESCHTVYNSRQVPVYIRVYLLQSASYDDKHEAGLACFSVIITKIPSSDSKRKAEC